MNCPVDNTVLVMSERNGVEIDYCPQCRGVWLDRGELDKILDRAAAQAPAPSAQSSDQRRFDDRGYQSGYQNGYPRKRKESWLSELFD